MAAEKSMNEINKYFRTKTVPPRKSIFGLFARDFKGNVTKSPFLALLGLLECLDALEVGIDRRFSYRHS